MDWGTVEYELEVRDWLAGLSEADFATVSFYLELLAEHGPLLGEPQSRQLRRMLRELRFKLGGNTIRVTYWIASGRRIVLLTVFCKTRRREERQVQRALRAFQRCVQEKHTAADHYRG